MRSGGLSALVRSRSFGRVAVSGALALVLGCPHSSDGLRDEHADANALPEASADGVMADAGATARPTHSGLISIQRVAFPGLPAAGEGLTLQALFTRATQPVYEEQPGAPTGCKAYSYELPSAPPPALEDHGAITVRGLAGGDLRCTFAPGRGYDCDDGSAPTAAGVRYLQRAFTPNLALHVALAAGGERGWELPEVTVQPGGGFVLDEPSRALIGAMPVDGRPITLGCAGVGGSCQSAQASIVRITTTDADLSGLSPLAMPPPARRSVEIQCAALDAGSITITEPAMQLLRRAHLEGALTRIRTAFMRDGIALVANAPPAAPNRLVVAAGHAVIAYTDVSPSAR